MNLLQVIVKTIDDKLARNIRVIDVRSSNPITSYFVIADADNERQCQAVANAVEDALASNHFPVHHLEGRNTRWVLVDAFDVIVHVFHTEERAKYSLDKLWADYPTISVESLLTEGGIEEGNPHVS